MQMSGVGLSVRLSLPVGCRTLLRQVCCCESGGQEILMDAALPTGRRSAAAMPQQRRVAARCRHVVG